MSSWDMRDTNLIKDESCTLPTERHKFLELLPPMDGCMLILQKTGGRMTFHTG